MKYIKILLIAFIAALMAGCSDTAVKGSVEDSDSSFSEVFANPPAGQRLKVRTWWPSADITSDQIAAEVRQIAEAGFGGIELIGITEGFAPGGETVIDAESDGWGTDNWNAAVATLMTEAEKYGISVDLTIGPRWPAGIPELDPNSDAAYRKLTYGAVTLESPNDAAVEYALPEIPKLDNPVIDSADFVGLVAAKLLDVTEEINVFRSGRGTEYSVINKAVIDESTLAVVPPENIDLDAGRFSFAAPSPGRWVVYAYWAVGTGQTSGDTVPVAYVVNHFNKSGTQAIIDYWENTLLTEEIAGHFERSGGNLFEDSLELEMNDLPWCNEMADYFKSNKGYDLVKVLPLLMGKLSDPDGEKAVASAAIGSGENTIPAGASYSIIPAPIPVKTETTDEVLADFAYNLSDMYIENHIEVIRQWCNSHNIAYRAQAQGTSDNGWVDSIDAAAYLDVAEGESLGFCTSPDGFRSLAGAANMAGTNLVSVELGAEFGALYQVTWQQLVELVNRAASAGANQFVLHGFATSSQYNSNTRWPGWMPFDEPRFSERWNPAQPSWAYMKEGLVDYISRLQASLQFGTAAVDFAAYRKDLGIRTDEGHIEGVLYLDVPDELTAVGFAGNGTRPGDNIAVDMGYSYNYISPGNFDLANCVVENGILNPGAAGYRAFVVNNIGRMEAADAGKILSYANAGLPIVVIGALPVLDQDHTEDPDGATPDVFEKLLALPNTVHIDDQNDLPSALKSLGVAPDARFSSREKISAQHRTGKNADIYYLYNRSTSEDYGDNDVGHDNSIETGTTVTLRGTGRPYDLDPWTGAISGIDDYVDNGDGTLSIPIVLKDNEVMLIGIGRDASVFEQGGYALKTEDRPKEVISSVSLDDGWTLGVESWEPGAPALLDRNDPGYNPCDIKKVDKGEFKLDKLVTWSQIPELEEISGIGTYTKTFTLAPDFDRALLSVGKCYDNILEVSANGEKLPPIDQATHELDLGNFVKAGENTITIKTGTTLAAAVRKAGGNVSDNDQYVSYPTAYGLLGGIEILLYSFR